MQPRSARRCDDRPSRSAESRAVVTRHGGETARPLSDAGQPSCSKGTKAEGRMRKLSSLALLVFLIGPAYAEGGNGAPTGAHYHLNVIGVHQGKPSPIAGSERPTIV